MSTNQMTDAQVARLQRALDDLETGKRKHNQGTWMQAMVDGYGVAQIDCGSAMCLAGDVVLNEGWLFVDADTHNAGHAYQQRNHVPFHHVIRPQELAQWQEDPHSIVTEEVEDTAREALGLDRWEAIGLFDSSNTLEKLWALSWWHSNGRITLPARMAAHLRQSTPVVRSVAMCMADDAMRARLARQDQDEAGAFERMALRRQAVGAGE